MYGFISMVFNRELFEALGNSILGMELIFWMLESLERGMIGLESLG